MKAVQILFFALMSLSFMSCQNQDQEATAAGIDSLCISQPTSCNSSLHQQNSAFTNYGNAGNPFYYVNNSAYLCNCPQGYVPTYNSYSGLGCVRTSFSSFNFFGNGFYAYLYLGWSQNQWYLQPQLYTYNHSSGFCYSGALQSCVVGQSSNSCPAGSVCRQNSSSSSLGLCVTSVR